MSVCHGKRTTVLHKKQVCSLNIGTLIKDNTKAVLLYKIHIQQHNVVNILTSKFDNKYTLSP